MRAMGFSDGDGWLTQHLTMKNGNIGQVLNILMPIQKTKNKYSGQGTVKMFVDVSLCVQEAKVTKITHQTFYVTLVADASHGFQ
jgi:hypothetical protein